MRHRIYVASVSWYLSQTHNFARLLIVATQISHLNCPSQLKLHGNNVCDIIIAHKISAGVQIYLYTVQTDAENVKRPAGRVLCNYYVISRGPHAHVKTVVE